MIFAFDLRCLSAVALPSQKRACSLPQLAQDARAAARFVNGYVCVCVCARAGADANRKRAYCALAVLANLSPTYGERVDFQLRVVSVRARV